jgi:hypothetical protein
LTTVAALFVGLAIGYDAWNYRSLPPCHQPVEKLDQFGTMAFQLMSEMNKYLISLATVVLAGLGAVAVKLGGLGTEDERSKMRDALVGAAVFGTSSLYFGFISHVRIAEVAINRCTEFGDKLEFAQFLQFCTLLLGVGIAMHLAIAVTRFKAPND